MHHLILGDCLPACLSISQIHKNSDKAYRSRWTDRLLINIYIQIMIRSRIRRIFPKIMMMRKCYKSHFFCFVSFLWMRMSFAEYWGQSKISFFCLMRVAASNTHFCCCCSLSAHNHPPSPPIRCLSTRKSKANI